MPKTIWMDRLVDLRRKGGLVCFVLESEGKTVHVRCERPEALAAIKFSAAKWCELDHAEQKATVVPIRKR